MKITRLLLILAIFSISSMYLSAQVKQNKYEVRGVWMASLGIDWPSSQGTNAATISAQKKQLIEMLNIHKAQGINTIYFHIRPACDAVYKSSYEPWSAYLTGTQGQAPEDPNYDPLTFAIEECHKRGMELHAWVNPYRAMMSGGSLSNISQNHVIFKHPEWILKCTGTEYRFLDPGNPRVREYVTKVVMDVVNRYNVDGIHFDDYFYAYSAYGSYDDSKSFKAYNYGFSDRGLWRVNNVNLLLKMLNDSIKTAKPWVKFGMSPSASIGMSEVYGNPTSWMAGNYTDTTGVAHTGDYYIDYIVPQLYSQRYSNADRSWAQESFLHGRQLYIGMPAYKYSSDGWLPDEFTYETTINRNNPLISGGIFFSAKSIIGNMGASSDSMKYSFCTHPALIPPMKWIKGSLENKPLPPKNLKMVKNSASNRYELNWDKAEASSTGDTAFFYAVYRFESLPGNTETSENLFGLTGETYLNSSYAKYSVTNGNYYCVASVDRYGNESDLSEAFLFDTTGLKPTKVELLLPVDGDDTQKNSTTLSWKVAPVHERFNIQVSTDPSFKSNILTDVSEYTSGSLVFKKNAPDGKYFWRVTAYGVGGQSASSEVRSFESGFPGMATLVEPAHASINMPLNVTFKWLKNPKATSYKFQLSTSSSFAGTPIKNISLTDTTTSVSGLQTGKFYYWRISSENALGTSGWTKGFGFRTTTQTGVDEETTVMPAEYALMQNYPNPFNPSTVISYQMPEAGRVTLKIYDILGNEVASLIDEFMPAGNHSYNLNIGRYNVSSGIYFYSLTAGSFHQVKKMTILK